MPRRRNQLSTSADPLPEDFRRFDRSIFLEEGVVHGVRIPHQSLFPPDVGLILLCCGIHSLTRGCQFDLLPVLLLIPWSLFQASNHAGSCSGGGGHDRSTGHVGGFPSLSCTQSLLHRCLFFQIAWLLSAARVSIFCVPHLGAMPL